MPTVSLRLFGKLPRAVERLHRAIDAVYGGRHWDIERQHTVGVDIGVDVVRLHPLQGRASLSRYGVERLLVGGQHAYFRNQGVVALLLFDDEDKLSVGEGMAGQIDDLAHHLTRRYVNGVAEGVAVGGKGETAGMVGEEGDLKAIVGLDVEVVEGIDDTAAKVAGAHDHV